MKKTLLVALLISFAANAQVREKGNIEIQPFAGFSTSKLYTSDDVTYKSIVSPYFGVNAEFYFNSKWSLRTGLEFMQIGSKNPRYFNSGWNNIEEI
ncbi:outer membrane beta-barrel protein [Flavobacterium dauae]|uniref:outer membrane beta-barrel protein n=1 Tax=Flavobacterium dauae TaxID=1563479 RepID=UPI00101B23B3|nr:outer membrane beta-barrel protein [Flavobacterium dauae]WLD22942.1 outer membrane beta-barrel protein [Flavobacterium dauae]